METIVLDTMINGYYGDIRRTAEAELAALKKAAEPHPSVGTTDLDAVLDYAPARLSLRASHQLMALKNAASQPANRSAAVQHAKEVVAATFSKNSCPETAAAVLGVTAFSETDNNNAKSIVAALEAIPQPVDWLAQIQEHLRRLYAASNNKTAYAVVITAGCTQMLVNFLRLTWKGGFIANLHSDVLEALAALSEKTETTKDILSDLSLRPDNCRTPDYLRSIADRLEKAAVA